MPIFWSTTQQERLRQLHANETQLCMKFKDQAERNQTYQRLERTLVQKERQRLADYFSNRGRPRLIKLDNQLAETLAQDGFIQVTTPILMSKEHLARMTIDDRHCLAKQVFWVSPNQCLRPMLAPHLYFILKDLLRLCEKPVRIFEIGPCFRKESQGHQHLNEFTMLNVVEMGLPEDQCAHRLEKTAHKIMRAAGIKDFKLAEESSTVYGQTVDIVSLPDGIELGSGAMGPHPLDDAWGITDAWMGIGFGLERLLMAGDPDGNVAKFGRSLTYLDGIRLNI